MLTERQQEAVDKDGTNIIVSAGAGSGKTTVLKERVLRKLKSGISINKLIILTFTNNAASEMKERIRKIINSNNLTKESELLDEAYITTFDSYAQSIVKKYSYLLNMDNDFTIVDSSIVNLEINNILESIFLKYYESNNNLFNNLIESFCIKDDKKIRDSIINAYKVISLKLDKNEYLNNYIDMYYSDEYINNIFDEYEEYYLDKKDEILNLYDELVSETLDDVKLEQNNNSIENFIGSLSYDDMFYALDFKLADSRGEVYTDYGKELKSKIHSIRDELKKELIFDKNELIDKYKSTKDYCKIIIDIIKELDTRLNEFKRVHNSYEFNDIAFKLIELVENNESIRNEIKYNTNEIMIDEYQDTNDIQDKFISLIENNNVYMVGDIKQSIYRFRNANPYLFKSKYESYSNNINGYKIDLNKNFRSRNEVIDGINLIFNNIMYEDIGGADYKNSHQMIFGNDDLKNNFNNQNYNLEILNYNTDTNKEDTEAFIIADDILKRVGTEKVYDGGLRYSKFSDFVILVDKGRNFEKVKKILEYKGIPVQIDKDININDEDEIYILKNIINLIILVKNNKFNSDFKHSFMSIERSYIMDMNDDELFDIIINNKYKDTELYKLVSSIVPYIDSMSNKEILNLIVDKFDIVNKLNSVGNVSERLIKIEYFINNASSLNDFGYDIYNLNEYFDLILNSNEDIKMTSNIVDSNSVKIMTIHKSKGLEFSYVYMPYLNTNFNSKTSHYFIDYSKKYGFLMPFYDNGSGDIFTKVLNTNLEKLENFSEKIRLFYVGVTRAKEKIILVNSYNEKVDTIVNKDELLKLKSFSDILSLLKDKLSKYTTNIDVESLDISKEYNNVSKLNYKNKILKSNKKIEVNSINLDNELIENKHFSKVNDSLMNKEIDDNLKFGTFVHNIFETYDFNSNNEYIKKLMKHDEFKNIFNAKIYKEHEIRYKKDNVIYHGFIDLLIEYDDYFDIVDYKLLNIDDSKYINQLNGYKEYIKNKYNKKVNIYLYSILTNELKKIG